MSGLFQGVRILDFTRFFAGPFGSHQFALQGADVIKVEPPEGEDQRRFQSTPEWVARNMAPAFASVNVNKRSLTLDLRKPEARQIIERLVADADVVWENFRPGVMERLGFGYDALKKINPRLIYCAVSGFGQDGPERGTAAFDGKIQAMTGLMTMTGNPEDGPMRTGIPICDLIGGLSGAFAVSAALYRRSVTGEGEFLDVSMVESTLNVLTQQVSEVTMAGIVAQQYGNLSVTRKVTADRFACGGGYLMLAILLEKQYVRLMETIGRADTLSDPRFADWQSRSDHAGDLRAIIEGAMREGTPEAWAAKLTAADVPCSVILSIDETLQHPQVQARGFLQTVPSEHGPMTFAGPGFRTAKGPGQITRAPVAAGADNDDILTEAGFSPDEISAFRSAGVL
ncbi:CaiB/BaiF CoA transferase family protein [Falsigemmobacter intermedius]|uniref:CaiB/BaiF CoA transferase family protein n=1 Tax=Falsigemmobacter intermedius TaxID=1553448 RepID=UPI003EFE84BC